ncbi:MAG: hypothetical protein R3B70_44850, partial [Polyangiaceae bacterium]
MARSRSSFELTSAIATASTLAREEKKKAGAPASAELPHYDEMALVSFQLPEGPGGAAQGGAGQAGLPPPALPAVPAV